MTARALLVLIPVATMGLRVDLRAQPRLGQPELSGLWGSEQSLPLIKGELTIDAQPKPWRARIAGFEAPIEAHGDAIGFELPRGLGEFRGRLSPSRKSIAGHWIQPISVALSQRHATPTALAQVASLVWRGMVSPLEERLSFYVFIQMDADGMTAVIRNPDFGWLNGRYRVEATNDSIILSNGRARLDGRYDVPGRRLLLNFVSGSPTPVVLTKRNDQSAAGWYPRAAGERAVYRYSRPIQVDDGWHTSTLSDAGLDPRPLTALVQSILDADPADVSIVPIHSLLIARRGRLVLEEYFYGFDAQRPHDTRSAGKTLGPMLIGVARDHGGKVEPATPLYRLFPQYKPFARWDERKARITVRDVMTMTPGWDCDDNDANSLGRESTMQSQPEGDWYKYALDLPMVRQPGGSAAIYCSASLNLTGGVAGAISQRWNAELFHEYIAAPLQFGIYHLNLMPSGLVYTGGGVYLRPRDELKLGQLYLSGGVWNGRRVLSTSWVEESTRSHSRFSRPVVPTDLNHEYGYGWHIHHFTVDGRTYREYAAEGAGGQFVIVLPELDMVMAINAGDYRSLNWYTWMLEMIPRYVIPAAAGSNPR